MQFFAVHAEGISRQMNYLNDEAVYFRLLPRNSATQEGKRHVKTVPVKLTRAKNDKHSTHPDTLLARASISNLEGLASLLGPQEVTFHSQDDKEVHTNWHICHTKGADWIESGEQTTNTVDAHGIQGTADGSWFRNCSSIQADAIRDSVNDGKEEQ